MAKLRRLLWIGAVSWLPFFFLSEGLLEEDALNKRDLPPVVGSDTGSLVEIALNVWHWDLAFFFLMGLGLICVLLLALGVGRLPASIN